MVGGGFGGLELANKLAKSGFQIVLVDKNNYHQFLPMIYEVASAGVEPSSIAFPFRKIFQKRKDFYYRWADVTGVDSKNNLIETSIGPLKYDYLILATGTTTNYFGNENIENAAMPMKTVEEAMAMRNALLANLEKSLTTEDLKERQALQNIVIVGGGATGVEVSGALSEMKKFVIPKDYPEMEIHKVNVYLIEAGPKLLAAMSANASENAEKFLRGMGVNVMLNTLVQDYKDGKVILNNGMDIPTRTFIWVSGVIATSFDHIDAEMLGRGRRILVDEFNRVKGIENVFAIGDVCLQTEKDYPNGHPQLAQVAIQQGHLLASNLKKLEKGKALSAFHYRNLGSLATIGRNKAVADFKKVRMHGWFAWVIWLVVHLRSILGVRNKVVVLLNWVWSYLTYDRSIRLIMAAKRVKKNPVDRK
ncbi:NAD(P)/FAD-dependent oxidoreductase [Bacteroides ihuae]|uniref:NAD(P)/FAD-dependent oxidoreductase n=1 Tax=Bacteroides ihuae TaxID=1852362 RepID=UPI000990174C|nr:NAD(P)/FAD-dependent oxidoreductase [Bacteroides ihuae]